MVGRCNSVSTNSSPCSSWENSGTLHVMKQLPENFKCRIIKNLTMAELTPSLDDYRAEGPVETQEPKWQRADTTGEELTHAPTNNRKEEETNEDDTCNTSQAQFLESTDRACEQGLPDESSGPNPETNKMHRLSIFENVVNLQIGNNNTINECQREQGYNELKNEDCSGQSFKGTSSSSSCAAFCDVAYVGNATNVQLGNDNVMNIAGPTNKEDIENVRAEHEQKECSIPEKPSGHVQGVSPDGSTESTINEGASVGCTAEPEPTNHATYNNLLERTREAANHLGNRMLDLMQYLDRNCCPAKRHSDEGRMQTVERTIVEQQNAENSPLRNSIINLSHGHSRVIIVQLACIEITFECTSLEDVKELKRQLLSGSLDGQLKRAFMTEEVMKLSEGVDFDISIEVVDNLTINLDEIVTKAKEIQQGIAKLHENRGKLKDLLPKQGKIDSYTADQLKQVSETTEKLESDYKKLTEIIQKEEIKQRPGRKSSVDYSAESNSRKENIQLIARVNLIVKNDFVEADRQLERLEAREAELAASLRDRSATGGSSSVCEILQQLGDVYKERGLLTKSTQHFATASALYNAAFFRAKEADSIQNLEMLLRQNETAFCKILSISNGTLPVDFRSTITDKLETLRHGVTRESKRLLDNFAENLKFDAPNDERIEVEKTFVIESRKLSQRVSNEIPSLCKEFFSKSCEILGPPPHDYAVIAFGSLTRGDVTPCSGRPIKLGILCENGCSDVEYFKNMMNLVHMFGHNMGETDVSNLKIKSVSPGGVTTSGFSLDSSSPYSDVIVQERNLLVATPAQMAEILGYGSSSSSGQEFTDVLQIHGSAGGDSLFKEFEFIKSKKSESGNWNLLSEIQNCKEGMFAISLFKPLFRLENNNVWEILDEMRSKAILSEEAMHNLQVALSVSALFRLLGQNCDGKQNEWYSVSQLLSFLASSKSDYGEVPKYSKYNPVIIRYCCTALPFFAFLCKQGPDFKQDTEIKKQKFCDEFLLKMGGVLILSQVSGGKSEHIIEAYLKSLSVADEASSGIVEEKALEWLNEISTLADRLIESRGTTAQDTAGIGLSSTNDDAGCHIFAPCLGIIGQMYSEMGKHELALKYYQQSLTFWKRLYGERNRQEVVACLSSIGCALVQLGNYNLALKFLQDCLDMQRRISGIRDDSRIASCLNNLGNAFTGKGDYESAERCYTDSLSMMKRLHGDKNRADMASCLCNMGNLCKKLGKHEIAMHYLQNSLSLMRRTYGEDHPKTALTLDSIGSVHNAKGEYQVALGFFENSFAMKKRVLGDVEDFGIAASINDIGGMYYKMGKYNDALTYLKQSMSILENILKKKDHPDIAHSLSNIGIVYSTMNQNQQALRCFQKSLDMMRKVYHDADHPDIAPCLNNIGNVYSKMENYQSALEYYRYALKIWQKVYGNDYHPDIVRCLHNMSIMCSQLNDHVQAQRYNYDSLQVRTLLESRGHKVDVSSGLAKGNLNVGSFSSIFQLSC